MTLEDDPPIAAANNEAEENEEEVEDTPEIVPTLIGSGEYQIVDIRYYHGVAHPGEYIELVREPHNPYDRNAIRADNLRGEKIGHVKAITAKTLAPLMNRRHALALSFCASIQQGGNEFTLPLCLEEKPARRSISFDSPESLLAAMVPNECCHSEKHSHRHPNEIGLESIIKGIGQHVRQGPLRTVPRFSRSGHVALFPRPRPIV